MQFLTTFATHTRHLSPSFARLRPHNAAPARDQARSGELAGGALCGRGETTAHSQVRRHPHRPPLRRSGSHAVERSGTRSCRASRGHCGRERCVRGPRCGALDGSPAPRAHHMRSLTRRWASLASGVSREGSRRPALHVHAGAAYVRGDGCASSAHSLFVAHHRGLQSAASPRVASDGRPAETHARQACRIGHRHRAAEIIECNS